MAMDATTGHRAHHGTHVLAGCGAEDDADRSSPTWPVPATTPSRQPLA
jgi:hypothetical protein